MNALDDVRFQLVIWGHAYTGDALEPAALTAELRPGKDQHVEQSLGLFDRTARDLVDVRVCDGDSYRRPPDHWALPWMTEHRMRQEADGCLKTPTPSDASGVTRRPGDGSAGTWRPKACPPTSSSSA